MHRIIIIKPLRYEPLSVHTTRSNVWMHLKLPVFPLLNENLGKENQEIVELMKGKWLTNEFIVGNFDFSVMIQGSQGAEIKNIGDQYFGTHWQGATSDVNAVVEAGIISHPSFLQPRIHTNEKKHGALSESINAMQHQRILLE